MKPDLPLLPSLSPPASPFALCSIFTSWGVSVLTATTSTGYRGASLAALGPVTGTLLVATRAESVTQHIFTGNYGRCLLYLV